MKQIQDQIINQIWNQFGVSRLDDLLWFHRQNKVEYVIDRSVWDKIHNKIMKQISYQIRNKILEQIVN